MCFVIFCVLWHLIQSSKVSEIILLLQSSFKYKLKTANEIDLVIHMYRALQLYGLKPFLRNSWIYTGSLSTEFVIKPNFTINIRHFIMSLNTSPKYRKYCLTNISGEYLFIYRTMWSRYRNVVVGGHAFEKGNRWGRGKRNGEEGGGTAHSQPGIRADRDRATTEEGFQVSKRGVQGIRIGISKQKKKRGLSKGLSMHLCIYHANRVYITVIKDCV